MDDGIGILDEGVDEVGVHDIALDDREALGQIIFGVKQIKLIRLP